jgi:hypothetical protein
VVAGWQAACGGGLTGSEEACGGGWAGRRHAVDGSVGRRAAMHVAGGCTAGVGSHMAGSMA